MAYSSDDLLEDIRSLQFENLHGMGAAGRPGVSPTRLSKNVLARATLTALMDRLTDLRDQRKILILGKRSRYQGLGTLSVIELPLNEHFFSSESGRWLPDPNDTEGAYNTLRIYVLADGLPETVARNGAVQRALKRAAQ